MKRVTVFYADRIYEESDVAEFHTYPDGAFIRVRQKNGLVVWWENRDGATISKSPDDLPPVIKTYLLIMQ